MYVNTRTNNSSLDLNEDGDRQGDNGFLVSREVRNEVTVAME
jgi:hypothetical protein